MKGKISLPLLAMMMSVMKLAIGQEVSFPSSPCSTNDSMINYNLYSGTIANFHSPNYPKNMAVNETVSSTCKARFSTIIDNTRLYLALYNGVTSGLTIYDDNYNRLDTDAFNSNDGVLAFSSKTQSLTFEFVDDGNPIDWAAFQGVVVAYDPQTPCPFAKGEIDFINLEDALVLPIASDFGEKQGNVNCTWSFSTYFGQYLKIVIKNLVVNKNVKFELWQNQVLIKKFDKNITQTEVHYFTADVGNFRLYYNDTNTASIGTGFSALVSDAQLPASSTFRQCQSSASGDTRTISNLDYDLGYKANEACEFPILLQQNQEALINVKTLYIEKNVDKFFINDGRNYTNLYKDDVYQLKAAANNTYLSFYPDSNMQQAGFEVIIQNLDCVCSDSEIIVPCDGSIEMQPLVNSPYYCDQMSCTYTILKNDSCQDDGYKMSFNFGIRNGSDYFLLYTNETLRENITDNIPTNRIFSADTDVKITFISGQASQITQNRFFRWSISLEPITFPSIDNFLLTEDIPTHVVNLNDFDNDTIISVCSPENDTLELFLTVNSATAERFLLYDGNDLNNFIGTLRSPLISTDSDNIPRNIASTSNCFTIYNYAYHHLHYGLVLFRMKNAQSQNCENENNIVLLTSDTTTSENVANATGNCEMIFLPAQDTTVYIKSMIATPNKMLEFKSPLNQNVFAQLNSSEFSLWKNLLFSTSALSITLPPSTTFSINATYYTDAIYVNSNKQNGILTSTSFSGFTPFKNGLLYDIKAVYNSRTYNANFIVQDMEGNDTIIITSDYYSQNYSLTTVGENITIQGNQFQIYSSDHNPKSDTFLIEYSLTYSPPPTITTPKTVPPSTFTSTKQPTIITSTQTAEETTPSAPSTTAAPSTTPRASTTPTPTATTSSAISFAYPKFLNFITAFFILIGFKFVA